ncbi:MAG TPA: cyclopropane fatty acyl phospholipid synthase [Geopsychrobacteraceae bacterium]|nr:cyclopropane fatty acyl phospholipid synthase [Geopsychrobacteraceae bacterium]
MAINSFRNRVENLLAQADISIDGNQPWDVQVHKQGLFRRVLAQGTIGAGEAYMDGWWDCHSLDQFICRFLRAQLEQKFRAPAVVVDALKARLSNRQSRSRAFKVGQHHYDIGNDLYGHMLDSRMIYSCGYWPQATTLEQAQEKKLDLVCRKLKLQPGMRVLDIGCGWGGTARYIAERYEVEVVGCTVSAEQSSLAQQRCRDLPVQILLQDYRTISGTFDRILSIGMFEHVGYKNYRTYMETVARLLKDDGLFLLQSIGVNKSTITVDPWVERYIFPNSMLPSVKQIATASEGLFIVEDWHNFGPDYDKTLMAWYANFVAAWPKLRNSYGQRFYRMWCYYLLSCAGAFRARENQLWQIVLSKKGFLDGYRASR